MKNLPKRKLLELKKLHKYIIHSSTALAVDEWYSLSRRETKLVEKAPLEQLWMVCGSCFK